MKYLRLDFAATDKDMQKIISRLQNDDLDETGEQSSYKGTILSARWMLTCAN